MLNGGGDNPSAAPAKGRRRAEYRQIVGFGAAGGKDNLAFLARKGVRQRGAGLLNFLLGLLALLVQR